MAAVLVVGSSWIARAGSIVGYVGTLAVITAAVFSHYRAVNNAVLMGVALSLVCLLVTFCNDAAHRMAKRLLIS